MPAYDFICNECNQRFEVFLTYSEYGVANNSSSSVINVRCPAFPLSVGVNGAVHTATMIAYDRNGLALDNQNVSCDVVKMNSSGTVIFTRNLATTGGGNDQGAQNVSVDLGTHNILNTTFWQFQCRIPRKPAANQWSFLTYYAIVV